MLHKSDRIFVAGHRGLVGSAIVRRLTADGYDNIVVRTREQLDLTRQSDVEKFFAEAKPLYVFLAAARVGGILANANYPAEFIYQNLMIESNVIHAAYKAGARKLAFLGSSCIYPKLAPQPIREEYLLTSPLEPTNRAYAIAKIAGVELAASYRKQFGFSAISLMPTNVYGPGDNFDPDSSHVVPAMIRKFHDAAVAGDNKVVIWGTGTARREFMHVDDLADAAVFLMRHYDEPELVNVGTGQDLTIRQLAETIRDVVGFEGTIENDPGKPDGTPRKLLDVSRIAALGWRARIELEDGLRTTYAWYRRQQGSEIRTTATKVA